MKEYSPRNGVLAVLAEYRRLLLELVALGIHALHDESIVKAIQETCGLATSKIH